MLTSEKYENTVGPHIRNYLDHDLPSQQRISETSQHDDYPQDQDQPPKKRRKQSVRLVTVNGTLLCNSMQLKYNEILNAANKNRSLYVNFKEQLLSEGTLKWRFNSQDKDICVMSDINDNTGVLQPTSFVHITVTKDSTGQQFLTCTCRIYNAIQRSAKQENPLWPHT